MSLKKDDSGRHVAVEVELPGTPEDIWQAMATGPGYSAWFAPTQVDERVGGQIRFELGGGMVSTGQVTVWEPPYRFGYEETGWSGEAPPLATELTIEAKSGGTCVVRMVHSLFTERDDWDGELESMETGWPGVFRVLRIYLRDFAGSKAAMAGPVGRFDGSHDAAWAAVSERLGLVGVKVGDRIDGTPADAPDIAGTVEDIQAAEGISSVTLRLERPAPGVAMVATYAWGGKRFIALSLYFYGDEPDQALAHEAPLWEAWMQQYFPTPEETV